MRNAFILLVVVALVLVALGAVNHGLLFDIDFVAGTWTAVSLFWVAVVSAGVVFVTGMVAAFFARSGAVNTRRKLEQELQGTYERLRAAEAQLPRPAPVQAAVVEATPGEQTAVTTVAPTLAADDTRAAADAAPEAETAVNSAAPEPETAVVPAASEADTAVVTVAPEAATAVTGGMPEGEMVPAAEASAVDAADPSAPAAS